MTSSWLTTGLQACQKTPDRHRRKLDGQDKTATCWWIERTIENDVPVMYPECHHCRMAMVGYLANVGPAWLTIHDSMQARFNGLAAGTYSLAYGLRHAALAADDVAVLKALDLIDPDPSPVMR